MTEIERLYRQRIHEQNGAERIARVEALFEEMRAIVRRRMEAAHPDRNERAIRKLVAQALYRTDRHAQRLLSLLDG